MKELFWKYFKSFTLIEMAVTSAIQTDPRSAHANSAIAM